MAVETEVEAAPGEGRLGVAAVEGIVVVVVGEGTEAAGWEEGEKEASVGREGRGME